MRLLRAGICSMVAFAVLAHGAVEPWSEAVLEIGAGLLLVLWCALVLHEENPEVNWNNLLWPLAGFWLIAAVQSLGRLTVYPFATHIEWLKGSALVLLVFLAVQAFQTADQWRKFVWFLLIFGFVVSLFAIIQHFTFNGKLYWVRELRFGGVPFGPYVDRDHFAGFVELIAPAGLSLLILRGERRELWPMLTMFTLLPIGALFLSASRGGIIGFLCEVVLLLGLVFFRRMEGKTVLAGVIVLVLVAGVVGWLGIGRALERFEQYRGLEVTESRRVEMTRDTWKIFLDHPVLGTGFGTLQSVFPRYETLYDGRVVNHTHNDYVELLGETGATGGILAILFLALLLLRSWRAMDAGRGSLELALHVGALVACFGILVHSLVDFNLHIPSNALIFLLQAILATSIFS
ncbi:MAG TPA: O-antigen ligase family protein [Methylomirabilota bacterium]|nr:O-antigen ligase family protein [Methylomirabilota bacterium]